MTVDLIDATSMGFICCPETFDVIVASNLFGDTLTDISVIINVSMKNSLSANLNLSRPSI